MFKAILKTAKSQKSYQAIEQELLRSGIHLHITRKRVKNINFRLKLNQLLVSAPYYISDASLIAALDKRMPWAISEHAHIQKWELAKSGQQQHGQCTSTNPTQNSELKLWGKPQPLVMNEMRRIEWYRHELNTVMPALFGKWQPIVGKTATETRIKKMKTRWGSCNTKAKRVWLSVYLPAYPIECTEYVIVHELCHLHHPNHSAKFWGEVERVMPDYKRWHDRLAGKSKNVD